MVLTRDIGQLVIPEEYFIRVFELLKVSEL